MTTSCSTPMTEVARSILHRVCLANALPLTGWEHYYTGIGDDGCSVFAFDRAPEDGHGWLRIVTDPELGPRIDWAMSQRPA